MGEFDKALFEHKLGIDHELAEAVELRQTAIRVVEQFRQQELRDFLRKNATGQRKLSMWQSVFIYSAAASILLLAVSWALIEFYLEKPQTTYRYQPKNKQNQEAGKTIEKVDKNEISKSETGAAGSGTIENFIPEDLEPDPNLNLKEQKTADVAAEEKTLDKLTAAPPAAMSGEAPTAAGDDFKVQADELLLDTLFTALVLAAEVDIDDKSKVGSDGFMARKKETIKAVEPAFKATRKSEMKPVQVEIWKSPINYRGYRYNGKKVQLFGVQQPARIKFRFYQDNLYLVMAGQLYQLVKEDRYNSYWPETDKHIIQLLLAE